MAFSYLIERLADKSWNSIPRFSTLGVIRIKGSLAIAFNVKSAANLSAKILIQIFASGNRSRIRWRTRSSCSGCKRRRVMSRCTASSNSSQSSSGGSGTGCHLSNRFARWENFHSRLTRWALTWIFSPSSLTRFQLISAFVAMMLRQIHARHGHRRDPFFAADETHQLVRRRLDADVREIYFQGVGDAKFHLLDVRINFWRLCNDRCVHVHDFSISQRDDACGFLQKNLARHIFPARVGVREKMADVRFAERAEERIADGVHERVGVRMAVETLRVRNLDAAEDEFASRDQRVNVVADANVNHAAI